MTAINTDDFEFPPQPIKGKGNMRCVGFELELSGIDQCLIDRSLK
jgi:hypothetical protein